jgi:hypothetical protein
MTIFLPRLMNLCEINVLTLFKEPLHRPYAFTIQRLAFSSPHDVHSPFVLQGAFVHGGHTKTPNIFRATHVLTKEFEVRPIPERMSLAYNYKHRDGREFYDHFHLPADVKVGDMLLYLPLQ